MNKELLKDWADFYGRLVFVSAWNGLLRLLFVFFGGSIVQQAGLVDLRSISLAAFGWTLAGTIVASVACELYKHPLPEPKEPTQ